MSDKDRIEALEKSKQVITDENSKLKEENRRLRAGLPTVVQARHDTSDALNLLMYVARIRKAASGTYSPKLIQIVNEFEKAYGACLPSNPGLSTIIYELVSALYRIQDLVNNPTTLPQIEECCQRALQTVELGTLADKPYSMLLENALQHMEAVGFVVKKCDVDMDRVTQRLEVLLAVSLDANINDRNTSSQYDMKGDMRMLFKHLRDVGLLPPLQIVTGKEEGSGQASSDTRQSESVSSGEQDGKG